MIFVYWLVSVAIITVLVLIKMKLKEIFGSFGTSSYQADIVFHNSRAESYEKKGYTYLAKTHRAAADEARANMLADKINKE